jgi:hypothetical protein
MNRYAVAVYDDVKKVRTLIVYEWSLRKAVEKVGKQWKDENIFGAMRLGTLESEAHGPEVDNPPKVPEWLEKKK